MNTIALVDGAARDARYALRVLRKSPAFTLTAALTLALAIAVNTAVFSIVDAVLLKPLPYPSPERLAMVAATIRADGTVRDDTSQNGVTWETIRDHASTVDRAVYSTWPTGVNVVAGGRASYVQQQRVGARFFGVLGMAPSIGREFTDDEDRRGGPAATILSHGLWRALFNGDPSAIGRTLMLRGEAATIVGVMPEGFQSGSRADLWTPLRASTTGEGEGENYAILARVRQGMTWAQAGAEMQTIAESLAKQGRVPSGSSMSLWLQPLQHGMTTSLRGPLLMLWAAVAIVLLIASVNLSGLLLARASARTREIATRMALGSRRSIIVRQLLVESVVLAAVGGLAGVALGAVALAALRALAAHAFELWQPVSLDARAVTAAGALALAATAVFGVVPAVHATRLDVNAALMNADARTVAGGASRWPRRLLVMAQVALGVVLLVGAGLLVRTFSHLRHLDPGFEATGVVTASVSLEDARYRSAARVSQMFRDTLSHIRQAPGIEAAAVSLGLPYERLLNLGFRHLDGREAGAVRGRMTSATYVAGEFFSALQIPIRVGRPFDDRDRAESPGVAIVNEAFATQYFEGGNPVGRRIAFAGRDREIIAIVGNVQVRPGWGDNGPIAAMPLAYVPLAQASEGFLRLVHGWFSPAFIVRARAATDVTAAALRRALDASDPLLPFAQVRSMDEVRDASLAQQRFLMALVTGLAVAAALLAGVGLHGLIATTVIERRREMGIRIALGATRSQAIRSLALPGIGLALAGIAAGGLAAAGFVRLIQHFLWGVRPTDPIAFAAAAAILLAVASVGSVLPALRILRLDPATTLRRQ